MTLKLNGSSSGSVSIDAPTSTTSGADITFKLPVADGTAGQVLKTDASGNLSWYTPFKKVWGSTVDSTSGTDHVLLSSIPADCNRFGWGLVEVSVDTDGDFGIQMSTSGGYVTSNYKSGGGFMRTTNVCGVTHVSDAFICCTPPNSDWGPGARFSGNFEVNRVKNNIWSFSGNVWVDESTEYMGWNAGYIDISGALTAVRLHGEQTFDYGQIRAWYETGGT